MGNGEATTGEIAGLSVLNVHSGDFKLTFDKDKPGEAQRAAETVKDMLHRGYVIAIDIGDGRYKRVKRFDPATLEYIVRDIPRQFERLFAADKTRGVAIARSAAGCAREAW